MHKPASSLSITKLLTTTLIAIITVIGISFPAESSNNSRDLALRKEKMNNIDPIVVIETNKGTIKIRVFKNEAPITANNFIDLVSKGFYNGLTFHRYEPGFVIQGGDPIGNGTGGYTDPQTRQERCIQLEVKPSLKHDCAGMVAMARSNAPDSASSQFYITLAPASFLDMKYAVFGKVIDGLNIVQQLRAGDHMVKVAEAEGAATKNQ